MFLVILDHFVSVSGRSVFIVVHDCESVLSFKNVYICSSLDLNISFSYYGALKMSK